MATAERRSEISPQFELAPGVFVEPRNGYGERQLRERYERLYQGLHNENDPVTWRTTCVDIKFLLGVENFIWDPLPEEKFDQACAILQSLTHDTFHNPLVPEMLYAMGIPEDIIKERLSWDHNLDALVINGRHLGEDKDGREFDPEPCLFGIAKELARREEHVAFSNFIGRFSDNTNRVAAIPKLLHQVDRVIIVGSTQEMGTQQALEDVMVSISHPDFLGNVNNLIFVIPMFGGSRGDTSGQPSQLARESLTAIENARRIAYEAKVLQSRLLEEGLPEDQLPNIRFYSVDIHGPDYPRVIFEQDFEFHSVCPEEEYARRICTELTIIDKQAKYDYQLMGLPIKVINYDKGATQRTSRFVIALLENPNGCWKHIDVVTVNKTRIDAGEVKEAQVGRIDRWSLVNNEVVIQELWSLDNGLNHSYDGEQVPTMQNPSFAPCIIAADDDIIDSGITAEQNREASELLWRGEVFWISTFTHFVSSPGVSLVLERNDADLTLAGNSLAPPGLRDAPRVRSIDLSPSIVNAILNNP